jgi:hypothetical protein
MRLFKEGVVMRPSGNAIRGHETLPLHLDWEAVKELARKAFTRERMAEAAVVAATLLAVGYLGVATYNGLRAYAIGSF